MIQDYALTIFLVSAIASIFIFLLILFDIRNRKKHIEKYQEFCSPFIAFNPFKQLDLQIFLLTRKYLNAGQHIHVYDIYLLNLTIIMASFATVVIYGLLICI
jgi:hypothetical protein